MAASLAAAIATASAQPRYEGNLSIAGLPSYGFSSENSPFRLDQSVVGDFNGDGIDDALIELGVDDLASAQSGGIRILLGDGQGGLREGTAEVIDGTPPDVGARQFIIEDFNGDGHPDVFFDRQGPEPQPPPFPGAQNELWLSGPDGRLSNATATHLPQRLDFSHGSSAADVDGDGDLDLWVNNLSPGPAYLMLNDGSGQFTIVADLGRMGVDTDIGQAGRLPAELIDNKTGGWSEFIDTDLDGDPDLFLQGQALLINDGTGAFTLAPDNAIPAEPANLGINDIASLDINQDCRMDLVLSRPSTDDNNPGYVVQVLLGNGDGSFSDQTSSRIEGSPNKPTFGDGQIFYGDVDGDGDDDLLVTVGVFSQDGGPQVFFLENDGNGNYAFLPDGFVDVDPAIFSKFVPLDTNGDHRVELVYSSFVDDTLTEERPLLARALPPAALADPDGDGINVTVDNCPAIANGDQADADGDGKGNACDCDNDNDALIDEVDDDDDGDGVADVDDAFPLDGSETTDTDLDGIGNNADADDDNDGLSDDEELSLGTDLLRADSDGDGINDGDEVLAGTDPTVNVPAVILIFSSILLGDE